MATVLDVTLDPTTQLGSHGIDRVLLGINDLGRPVIWHRDVTPHLRLSGDTGKGKTVAAHTVVAHGMAVGDIVVHLDPKPGGAGWLAPYGHLATTQAGHHDALAWAVAEMKARQALRSATVNADGSRGVADIHQLPRHLPRVTVVLEEMGAIVGEMATLPDEDESEKEAIQRVGRNVTRLTLLVTQGRSEGVHVIGMTQYPTIEASFTSGTKMGGAIAANFGARIHLDAHDVSLRATFNKGGGVPDQVVRAIRAGHRGRGAYLHLDPLDEERVRVVQVWDIARATLVDLAATTPRPPADAYQAYVPPDTFDPVTEEYGP